MYTFCWKWV